MSVVDEPAKTNFNNTGYLFILERILRHYDRKDGPQAPYVVLDADSTVRYASETVSNLLKYEAGDLLGKSFQQLLSWDVYAAALRIVAHRADRAAREATQESAGYWYPLLNEEFGHTRELFAPSGKMRQVRSKISEFSRQNYEKLSIPSKIRVQDKDGSAVELKDEIILYRHPDGGYAGAMVILQHPDKKSNWRSYLHLGGGHGTHAVTGQYVVPVLSLRDKQAIQRTLAELTVRRRNQLDKPVDEELVLDFGMAEGLDHKAIRAVESEEREKVVKSVEEDAEKQAVHAVRAIAAMVSDRAIAGKLVIGNPTGGIEAAVQSYYKERVEEKVQVKYAGLQYAQLFESREPDVSRELASKDDLEGYINAKLNALEAAQHADAVPKPSLPPVQQNP